MIDMPLALVVQIGREIDSGAFLTAQCQRVCRAIAEAQIKRGYVGHIRETDSGAGAEIDRIWPQFAPEACAAIAASQESMP